MRMSATSRRRSGTVSSTALSANRKPIAALISANRLVDWSFGCAAWRISFSSVSLARTSSVAPSVARNRCCTASVCPGSVRTSTRVTPPGRPASSCA